MSRLQNIYRSLPAPVLRFVEPAKQAVDFLFHSRCDLWVLTGRERHGGEPFTVAYAGSDHFKNYVVGRVFADGFQERFIGRPKLSRAFEQARLYEPEIELFACEVPLSVEKVFRPPAFATLPAWIQMDACLGADSGVWRTKKFSHAQKLIKAEGLTLEVTQEPAQFEAFYLDLYLPYVRARHETAAVVDSLEDAGIKFVKEGRELLLVRRDGVLLGGIVIGFAEGVERFWILGVRTAEHGRVGAGAISDVLYYYAISRGRDRGCHTLNLGYCRSFVGDGLIRYKREWGARLVASRMPHSGGLALRFLKETDALRSFLRNNPFVSMEATGRYHVNGFIEGSETDGEDVAVLRSRYCTPGKLDVRLFAMMPKIVQWKERTRLPKGGEESLSRMQ